MKLEDIRLIIEAMNTATIEEMESGKYETISKLYDHYVYDVYQSNGDTNMTLERFYNAWHNEMNDDAKIYLVETAFAA